jgi:hypothetical protein
MLEGPREWEERGREERDWEAIRATGGRFVPESEGRLERGGFSRASGPV